MPGLLAQILGAPAALLQRSRAGVAASTPAAGPSVTEHRLDARKLATSIDRALGRGRRGLAEELSRLADVVEPKGPHLTEALARLRLISGDPETALALIDRLPERSGPLRLLRAACLAQLGGAKAARDDLRAWVDAATAPPEARTLLALLEWDDGDPHGATLAILRNRPQLDDPRSFEILMLIAVSQDRREQARVWARRLDAIGAVDAEDAMLAVLRQTLDLPAGPTTRGAGRTDHVAALARELPASEAVIPALVEAQRLQPSAETGRLLERAIHRALGELSDSATAFEALGRLALLRGDLSVARTWVERGLADHPMSVSLALLEREIDAAVPGGEAIDVADVLASIGGTALGDTPFAPPAAGQERRRMTRLILRRDSDDHGTPGLDRVEAARALRRVRHARGAAPAERAAAIDAAHAVLPDHRHVLAAKVTLLLDAGDAVSAQPLLAQALLAHPTDPMLAGLQARGLLLQDAPRQAESEIRLVRKRRPHHVPTLLLAARIAAARADHPGAIRALEDAVAARPRREGLREQLANALLDAGRVERAASVTARIRYPSAALRARLLAARGRTREALAVLDANRDPSVDRDGTTTIALIELLERIGPPSRLREILPSIDPTRPRALACAGAAWLRLGDHRTAIVRMFALRGPGPAQRDALAILLVAAAALGRTRLADRAWRRLGAVPGGAGHLRLAELWRRVLTARRIHPTASPRRRPRRRGVLEPLVHSALAIIERVMAPADDSPADEVNLAQLERHRAACLAVLDAGRRFGTAPARDPRPGDGVADDAVHAAEHAAEHAEDDPAMAFPGPGVPAAGSVPSIPAA